MSNPSRTLVASTLTAAALLALPQQADASSHREAPAIAEDQFADNTDVYAFISPTNPDNLVMVANYVPLLIPHSGPNFYRFSDNVRYEILIDTDGDAYADTLYHWVFHTTTENGETFLYNTGPIANIDDPNLNVKQTYDLYKAKYDEYGGKSVELVVEGAPVAPWHVGDRSFPDYDSVANQAITPTADGGQVFAGPRDEPFFVDLHVFDLLGVAGAPTTDGVNVMSLVLEVPITELTGSERPAAGSAGPDSVVGIYARAKRPIVTVRTPHGYDANFGGFQQVSRLAWPLINEVVVPLQDKDVFNRSHPADDVANFGAYILDPELTGLLNAVLGAGCADTPADGRLDIVGLLSPNGTTAADLLRININADQTFANSGFPNGRTLEDDVVDTLLTVVCNNGAPLGDGVDDNDLPFGDTMPYLASPHSGNPLP
ncbi:MAG: DUF4331 domain-containing protein [Myxococcota bacterium]